MKTTRVGHGSAQSNVYTTPSSLTFGLGADASENCSPKIPKYKLQFKISLHAFILKIWKNFSIKVGHQEYSIILVTTRLGPRSTQSAASATLTCISFNIGTDASEF